MVIVSFWDFTCLEFAGILGFNHLLGILSRWNKVGFQIYSQSVLLDFSLEVFLEDLLQSFY